MRVGVRTVRALVAAVVGVALAFGLAVLAVPLAQQGGPTSPRPLVTTDPAHP
jgi:hypothetical protein